MRVVFFTPFILANICLEVICDFVIFLRKKKSKSKRYYNNRLGEKLSFCILIVVHIKSRCNGWRNFCFTAAGIPGKTAAALKN